MAVGFLDLPGEIRNRIYNILFFDQYVLLQRSKPREKTMATSDQIGSRNLGRSARLYACADPSSSQRDQPLLFWPQLLRICRTVHNETTPLLYAYTTFRFDSMKVLNFFLGGASKSGMKQIKRLFIEKSGYGEPHKTVDTSWKIKHDRNWTVTCKKVAITMPGIQHLTLNLQICDWPCQLNLSAKWARPLYYLKGPEGLERVDIVLTSSRFEKKRLIAASQMVKKAMTSERGLAQRQLEQDLWRIAELERQEEIPKAPRQLLANRPSNKPLRHAGGPPTLKATRVLSIKMDRVSSGRRVAAAAQTPYFSQNAGE